MQPTARQRLIGWSYKYLPMIFGCHCIPERCLSYKGRPFPICARCTGEGIGILLAIAAIGIRHPAWYILLLLLLPMLLDAIVQRVTSYESNNTKRLITGALFGYAGFTLLLLSFWYTYQYGYHFGLRIFR